MGCGWPQADMEIDMAPVTLAATLAADSMVVGKH